MGADLHSGAQVSGGLKSSLLKAWIQTKFE